jgi:Amt family ammonium transporter
MFPDPGDVQHTSSTSCGGQTCGWSLLGDQVVAVVATLVYSFVVTFAIVAVLHKLTPGGIRVDGEAEDAGLDVSEHAEVAYAFAER